MMKFNVYMNSLADLEKFIKEVNEGISVEIKDEIEYDELVSLISNLRVCLFINVVVKFNINVHTCIV